MTHDYDITTVKVTNLNSTHVLVGESGGLSAVYSVSESYAMLGCYAVETEHGTLYVDSDDEFAVLA